ncbi:MAG: VCBS repeat-containing protein [Planctomycetes bacterium]|nr:VCBS repeat-containing protein [Planctomycetota bacterium]
MAGWFFIPVAAAACAPAQLSFRHRFVDAALPGGSWGQTALADLDGDGDLDFITGRSGGEIRWYEFRKADDWAMHPLGESSPSDVGGAVFDVDRDGRLDFVTGGAWYRNPPDPRAGPWPRHTFDADLRAVHDVAVADIDGDGRKDVITMSDRNDLRWYRIGADPSAPWVKTAVGRSVHAGLAAGDIDRDGDIDLVRSGVWIENLGKGTRWAEHRFAGIPWADRTPFPEAARAAVADIDRDGRPDIVLSEAEFAGGRIAWFEAPEDPRRVPWTAHLIPMPAGEKRGPFHSLQVADFDGDGDLDIFGGEMEHLGEAPHRWFIWENASGGGREWTERVILDANLGTHEAVAGDVDGDGDIDLAGKLWRPVRDNANGGRNHIDFLENLRRGADPKSDPKGKEK